MITCCRKNAGSKKKNLLEEVTTAADREFEANRYHSAKTRYTEAIRLKQNSPQLYARRAECNLILGDYDLATDDAKKACCLEPHCMAAISCLLRMGCIKELGDIYSALDEKFVRCCMGYKSFVEIKNLDSKIESFYKNKQFDECIRNIEMVIHIANMCRKYQKLHVECLIMTFRHEEATNLIDQHFKKLKDIGIKHFFLGLMYFVQDDLESSLKEFNESRKEDPDFDRASQLANTSQSVYAIYCSGKYIKRHLSRVLAIHSRKPLLTGLENYEKREFLTAKQCFMMAVSIFPGKTAFKKILLYNLASANIELHEYGSAMENLNEALRLDEEYIKALEKRANLHLKLREFENCITDLEEIMRLSPSDIVQTKIEKTKEAFLTIDSSELPTAHQILELESDKTRLTKKIVEKAYRKLTKMCHSDKYHNATKLEKKKLDRKMRNVVKARDDLIRHV